MPQPTTNNLEEWSKCFDEKFNYKIAGVIDDFGDNTKSDIKQFISDLRQADCEALIKMLPTYEMVLQDGCLVSSQQVEENIKNYYNK